MRKSTIIICIAVLSLIGCRSANKAEALLAQAQTRMSSAPDSALLLLEELDPHSLSSRSLRARHALLLSQALDKSGHDLTSDSIIAPAVSYFAHHGDNREKAYTNYYLGRIRDNAGDAAEAATLMMTAEKYAVKAGMTDLLGLIYNCRANLYYSQYSFDDALVMYDKADSCFRLDGKMAFSAFMLKAKARVYALQNKNEVSIATNRQALHIFDSLGMSTQACLATNSIAFLMQDSQFITTDSIKRFLGAAYSRYTSGETPETDYPIWAWIHFKEGSIDSAKHYTELALLKNRDTPDQQVGLLAIAGKIEEAAGNYRASASNWKQAHLLLDSLAEFEKVNLIQRAEARYENKELQHQNEMLHLRSKLFLSIVALVFTILAAAFVLTLRHWRRIINKKSEENKQYKLFIEKLSDDYTTLNNQYDQLHQQAANNSEEAHLRQAIEKRLNGMHRLLDLAYTSECKPQAFYAEFKAYVKDMKNDEFAFSDLEYVVNKRHHGVIDYIREQHPTLTNSEINMLAMMLYGFSLDCVRTIFNHDNTDSLYSRRTKIREKLGLPPRTKLEKYLQELSERLKPIEDPQEVA